jgi:hypothetical protein
VLQVHVKAVEMVISSIIVNVSQHVQMDFTVILKPKLVNHVIQGVQNAMVLKFLNVKNVMMDLIMKDQLVKHVIHHVQNVHLQNNLNAKDVLMAFILKKKLVHLVLVLVQHAKMIRFVILV